MQKIPEKLALEQIARMVGLIRSAISHRLGNLKQTRLITFRREGKKLHKAFAEMTRQGTASCPESREAERLSWDRHKKSGLPHFS